MTVTANHVIVTPAMAEKWLNSSKGNRSVRSAKVEQLAADMRAGLWRYNGDRIRFLSDGTLYDGHHRLTACVKSGVSIVTDTFVMDEDAKATVDKGISRTTADLLAMERGVSASKATTVAAAIRIMTVHDNTNLHDWAGSVGGTSTAMRLITDQSLQEYYEKHKAEVDEATEWAHENVRRQNSVMSKSQVVAFICLAARVYGKDAVYDYITKIITGYGIEQGTTADHIRSALVAVKMGHRKMVAKHKLYSVCKGFKSIMAGRSIKYAQNAPFRPSSDNIPRFEVGNDEE